MAGSWLFERGEAAQGDPVRSTVRAKQTEVLKILVGCQGSAFRYRFRVLELGTLLSGILLLHVSLYSPCCLNSRTVQGFRAANGLKPKVCPYMESPVKGFRIWGYRHFLKREP